MESNRKRRGFMKGKLMMSIYRSAAAKPPSTTTVQYSSSKVVKPNQSSLSTASVGYLVNQDYLVSQPKQRVSFIVPDNGRSDSFRQVDYNSFVGAASGDESVDLKAENYISCVQERFKLERSNSEWKKHQDMH